LLVPDSATVISKAESPDEDSYSAFGGTDLADKLRALDVRRLWIGGLALDYCVAATAMDGRALGFEVKLLLDATRPVEAVAGDGTRAIERMQAAGVHIIRGAST
jgi:nicotinamidase/pyrazinamidase